MYFSKFKITFFLSVLLFTIALNAQNITDKTSWLSTYDKGYAKMESQQFAEALPLVKEAYNTVANYYKEENEEYLNSLHAYAVSLYASGRIEESKPFLVLDLDLTKKYKGEEHKDYGERLNNLGLLYMNSGDYEKSEMTFEAALKNVAHNYGKDHEEYSKTLGNFGSLYVKTRDYDKALKMLSEALEVTERTLGKKSLNYILQSGAIAVSYQQMGKYNEALPLFINGREFINEYSGTNNMNYVIYTINIGLLYYFLEEHEDSINEINESITILESLSATSTQFYAIALSNLAMNYATLGDNKNAINLYLKAESIIKTTSGENTTDYAILLSNMAQAYLGLDDYKNALQITLLSKTIVEKSIGVENELYGTILANLTTIYSQLGNFEAALQAGKDAIQRITKSIGTSNDNYCKALSNLSQIYGELGNYEEAIKKSAEVLSKYASYNEKENKTKAKYLQNLANFYNHSGKKEASIVTIKKALAIMDKLEDTNSNQYAIMNNNLATFEFSSGNYEKSLEYYAITDKILNEKPNKRSHLYKNFKNNYGAILLTVKNLDLAFPIIVDANNVTIDILEDIFRFSSEVDKKKYIETLTADFHIYASETLRIPPNKRQALINLTLNNELILKGALLNSSKDALLKLSSLKDSLIDSKILKYRNSKRLINKQYAISEDLRTLSIDSLQQSKNDRETELVNLYSEKFNDKIPLRKHWKDIQTHLKKGEVAVEFSNFEYRYANTFTDSTLYVAYIIKPNKKDPKMIRLFEQDQLSSIIAKKSPNEIYNSKALYNIIWKPLEKDLKKSKTVYYTTSGLLNQIQFAAIKTEEDALLNLFDLNQLSSTYNIKEGLTSPELNNVHLFGGIAYDVELPEDQVIIDSLILDLDKNAMLALRGTKTRGESWTYLPATLKEVNSLSAKLEQKNKSYSVIKDEEATEAYFKSLSGNSPKIIHLATHGFFYEDLKMEFKPKNNLNTEDKYRLYKDPLLRSGIIMAGANEAWKNGISLEEKEDGILSAMEISNLDLSNTEIVILSACETGLGDIEGSEGVYGLQRAFKMAGVDILIMSLWKVPDEETAEFMDIFYTYWISTGDVRAAFNKTQQNMQSKYKDEPNKWAAFILFE